MESITLRSFFAIPLSPQCRQEFNKIILGLEKDFPLCISWVNNENLHITLKFLGEFKPKDILPIKNSLISALSATNSFTLSFKELGVFPNFRKPKVVWVGISPSDELFRLFQDIESVAIALGYPKEERGFSPHITIGRIKNNRKDCDLSGISTLYRNRNIGVICESHIEEVVFFQSKLTYIRSIYTELFSIRLNN